MSKILMLNSLSRTFLIRDYEILKSKFDVDLISGHSYIDYFKQWRRTKGYRVYFSWWGTSLHTVLFAKLFGGKSVIVAGGHEVADVKNIKLRPAESKRYQYLTGWYKWKTGENLYGGF